MISADALQDEVAAIGLLTGILTESGNDLTVNPDWFKDPLASTGPSLANVGERLQSLVTLIAAVLGPGIDNPPPVFSGAQWYAVPDPNTGGSTPFHVVAPAPTATGGEIGFGVLHAMQLDNFITEVYVYIPLFQYGSSGTEFIADGVASPCVVGLRASNVDGKSFQAGQVAFTALDIEGNIYLNPAAYTATPAPTFVMVVFEQLSGTDLPNTYTTLSDLLNTDVESWIGTVMLQGSSWLDLFIGDSPFTIGNILVAGGFITIDDQGDYSLTLDDLKGMNAYDIALRFLFGALNALSDSEVPYPILALPGGGLYFVRRVNADGTTEYGLRLAVEMELLLGQSGTGSAPQSLPGSAPSNGNTAVRQAVVREPAQGATRAGLQDGKPSPVIDLCLGSWLTGEDDTNNWFVRSTGNTSGGVDVKWVLLL